MRDKQRIIVYSGTNAGSVDQNLGKPDYSYYFILQKYLPILRKLGEVVSVDDPQDQVDKLYLEAHGQGRPAVFLSFTPPHNTVTSLRCPTICVLAWEFGSIPDEDWDENAPSFNWVSAIRKIGRIITISDYATRVIRSQVGPDVDVVTIPAPVDAVGNSADGSRVPAGSLVGESGPRRTARSPLCFSGSLVDSRECDIDAERVTIRGADTGLSASQMPEWDRREVSWNFVSRGESAGQYLVGFYAEEEWGCWSRTSSPEIILPWSLVGEFELELAVVGYGENQGRTVSVAIGDAVGDLVLPASMQGCRLRFNLDCPANSIHFSGLLAVPLPGARDHRTLGLGLRSLTIRPLGEREEPPKAAGKPVESGVKPVTLSLDGTVYTSLFNPEDGRKNWKDIVTAFCWAFRNDADKTLVLKMSHHNKSVFMGDLLLLFSKLHPFACRVVAIHGYLDDHQLSGLKEATDYYVNASSAEGQCLPLLEFMAEGIPAIAPDHTAMENYISEANSFVVRSSLEPQAWPVDPRRAYRTTTQRIQWDSLRQCYLSSAAVLENDAARYVEMARAAADIVAARYSSSKIERDLAEILNKSVEP